MKKFSLNTTNLRKLGQNVAGAAIQQQDTTSKPFTRTIWC